MCCSLDNSQMEGDEIDTPMVPNGTTTNEQLMLHWRARGERFVWWERLVWAVLYVLMLRHWEFRCTSASDDVDAFESGF
jgi:hypothetical protein